MSSLSRKDLSWLFDLLTLVAVIAGLTFAALELRQLREEQETQTILTLFEAMSSTEHIGAVQLVLALPDDLSAKELRKRLSEDEMRQVIQIHARFEALGVMVYRGDISLEWVDEMFRYTAVSSWEKLEQLTLERRKTYNGQWEWHQWLVERLRERHQNPVPAYEAYADWVE